MIELFKMGGMLFMSILSLLLVCVIVFFVLSLLQNEKQKYSDLMRSTGLLAMVIGILGQLIGLFSAFQAIEMMGSVSPGMLAGGLKVSSITTIYGMLIYIISLTLFLINKYKSE